jgi:hypothetical protein
MNTQKDRSISLKIVIGCILFFVLFSFAPTLYEWGSRGRIHDDRHFELVHNFPTDYNLYLSRIRQGKEGAWLATEKYTSEPHAASLSQILYVMIGRLADYSHVQTPYVWFAYHVARAFFAGLLLWCIWLLVAWMFRASSFQWQILTFLLIVTASTWPKFEWVGEWPRFGSYMAWYTMADSLQRTTFMPHITLAQALLSFIVLVFSGGFVRSTSSGCIAPGNWVFLGVIGIVLGIVFPPGLMFLYGMLGVVSLGELLFVVIPGLTRNLTRKNVKIDPSSGAGMTIRTWLENDLFGRIIFGIMTMPTLVYYYLLFGQYPWKRLVEFDVLHPTKFSYLEYFQAMGPLLPLGVVAVVYMVLRYRSQIVPFKYMIAWIVAWLGFLFVFNQIPQQSPTRFTQMAPHIPLGIVGAAALYQLGLFIKKFSLKYELGSMNYGKKQKRLALSIIHDFLFAIPILIISLGVGSMASSFLWQKDFVDHKLRATLPIVPSGAQVMYPMRETVDALTWLQVYTPRSSVVLSGMTTGNHIPVYAGNTAYVGHANTVRLEEKLIATERFYRGQMRVQEAYQWLKDTSISYIIFGFEERQFQTTADLRTVYPMLEQVYESPNIRIYKSP